MDAFQKCYLSVTGENISLKTTSIIVTIIIINHIIYNSVAFVVVSIIMCLRNGGKG
jgi:hypothetical protein